MPGAVEDRQGVLDEVLPEGERHAVGFAADGSGYRDLGPIPERLTPGGRPPALFRVARTLRHFGFDAEQMLPVLRAVNGRRCNLRRASGSWPR
jgi:hypothetical protein